MSMKKLLFLIVLIIESFSLKAQTDICGTKAGDKPIIFSKEQQQKINTILAINQPFTIKLAVTVFADDNGTNRAATDADIKRQIQNMVNQYQVHNICFVLMSISQVNNTDLNNHNITDNESTDESSEVIPFLVNGHLNIFIHKTLPGLNGLAYNIPNTYLSLKSGAVADITNITTMAHEMGHCFGLYHTFETWENTKKENVARSGSCKNCSSDGDVLCDTPADDDGGVDAMCNYIGAGKDDCNTNFVPMTSNIMGYGNRGCRTTFTADQGLRMRSFLINHSPLYQLLVNDIFYIPNSPNLAFYYPYGNDQYVGRDLLIINNFANSIYDVSGDSKQLLISKKVILKPGTRLHPSTGKVHITTNPYCN